MPTVISSFSILVTIPWNGVSSVKNCNLLKISSTVNTAKMIIMKETVPSNGGSNDITPKSCMTQRSCL